MCSTLPESDGKKLSPIPFLNPSQFYFWTLKLQWSFVSPVNCWKGCDALYSLSSPVRKRGSLELPRCWDCADDSLGIATALRFPCLPGNQGKLVLLGQQHNQVDCSAIKSLSFAANKDFPQKTIVMFLIEKGFFFFKDYVLCKILLLASTPSHNSSKPNMSLLHLLWKRDSWGPRAKSIAQSGES